MVHRDIRKNRIFNRRRFILTSFKAFLSSILIFRVGYLQLFKFNEYLTKSNNNRIKKTIVPAPRGNIFDRNNVQLTDNIFNYRLLLNNNKSYNKANIIKIAELLSLTKREKDEFLLRLESQKSNQFISLISNLSWQERAAVEANIYKFSNLMIEEFLIRHYKYNDQISHILGYVSYPFEKEVDKENKELFLHPDFKIGKYGIEKKFDKELRGKYGARYSEIDAYNIPIREISYNEYKQGSDINLTIDINIQKYIFELIKDLKASVNIIDIETGDIIAMVSTPSFNLNNFVTGLSNEEWNKINNNIENILNNKNISSLYSPGSIFKLIIATAAIEKNIDTNKIVKCNGKQKFGNRVFHCWKEEGHGKLNMSGAIKNSCNIYFYNLIKLLDIDDIIKIAKELGYNNDFDIDLYNFKKGILPTKMMRKEYYPNWNKGDELNIAIGQGAISVNPFQMNMATARIASGKKIIPNLIATYKNNIKFKKLNIKDDSLKYIRDAMFRVVNEEGGTAYNRYDETIDNGVKISGKTGTIQIISKRKDDMSEEELEKHKHHVVFTSFAPHDKPKYALTIFIENGEFSYKAANIAKKIFNYIYS